MAFQHKEGYGSLTKNKQKTKDTHPDYRGDIMMDGVVYELGGWIKKNDNGTFLSLSGKVKPEKAAQEAPKGSIADMADDIPFLFNCSTERDMMGLPKSLWRARYGKELQILRANEIDC